MEAGLTTAPSKQRYPELDGLRGLAILLVVLNHYYILPYLGGVNLFFVLSGFLLGSILMEKRGSENYFKAFYIRRSCRLLPLYLVFILAFFLIYTLLVKGWILPEPPKQIFNRLFADPHSIWYYLTFTQNFAVWSEGRVGPGGLSVLWSLAVEEQFVLILPLLIALVPPRWLPYLLVGTILAATSVRAGILGSVFSTIPYSPIILRELIWANPVFLGVLCAWIVRDPKRLKPLQGHRRGAYGVLVILAGSVSWGLTYYSFHWLTLTLVPLFFAFLLLIAITEKRGLVSYLMRLQLLRKLAPIAYGAFIFHFPVLVLTEWLVPGNGFLNGPWWSVAIVKMGALILTLTLATASWLLFEKRIAAWGRSFKYEKGATTPPGIPVVSEALSPRSNGLDPLSRTDQS